MELTFLSIIPSLLAIFLALKTKNVFLSLLGGIILGSFFIRHYHIMDTFFYLFSLFSELLTTAWILKTLAFAFLIGGIIELLEKSGSINGFVHFVSEKNSYIDTPKKALLVSYIIGIVIFIESSITSLIAGAVGKPLCDKEGVSHEKLAFVCDSTSAPVSSLILLNGWGALLLGLVTTQIQTSPVDLLIDSVLYNFYAWSILIITLFFIIFDFCIGPIRYTHAHHYQPFKNNQKPRHPLFMLLPVL